MPDWRKPKDYAYTATLTLHQWAWEFLRRNKDYREDWRSFQSRVASGELRKNRPGDLGEGSADLENLKIASKWDLYVLADPSIAAHEMKHSPDFRYTTDVSIYHGYTGQSTIRNGIEFGNEPFNPVLMFNLLVPIDSQLKVAKKLLLHLRRRIELADEKVHQKTSRPQRAKFPSYVRILDARLTGLSEGKIGKALYPRSYDPRLRAREVLSTARKLATSGYRDLLLTPDTWHRL